MILFLDPVPIILRGEGDYALTDIRTIQVTEEFLGLGEEITQCQTNENRGDCVSRKYQEQVLASCNCTPLYLQSYFPEKVYYIYNNHHPITIDELISY